MGAGDDKKGKDLEAELFGDIGEDLDNDFAPVTISMESPFTGEPKFDDQATVMRKIPDLTGESRMDEQATVVRATPALTQKPGIANQATVMRAVPDLSGSPRPLRDDNAGFAAAPDTDNTDAPSAFALPKTHETEIPRTDEIPMREAFEADTDLLGPTEDDDDSLEELEPFEDVEDVEEVERNPTRSTMRMIRQTGDDIDLDEMVDEEVGHTNSFAIPESPEEMPPRIRDATPLLFDITATDQLRRPQKRSIVGVFFRFVFLAAGMTSVALLVNPGVRSRLLQEVQGRWPMLFPADESAAAPARLATTGYLTLTSKPAAAVTINEKRAGKTPLRKKKLPVGDHQLTLIPSGLRDDAADAAERVVYFSIRPDETVTLQFDLTE